MTFQFQKVSNYGTSTPAVARTLFQGSDILGFFSATDEQREKTKSVLHELQRHLVRCVEVRDQIQDEVKSGHEEIEKNGFRFQSSGRVATLPGVGELQSRAEAFLQSAKLAIAETAHLVEPFYGLRLDHRYQKFVAWAENKFGATDTFAQALRNWEPWVKRVIEMRNAVDHPKERPGGKLVTENFKLSGPADALVLVDPTWGLLGETRRAIFEDMEAVIEGIIELGEEVLRGLFYKLKHDFPLVIYEIPREERDPSCPVRLRVGLENQPPSA